jgi:hypothetical protein
MARRPAGDVAIQRKIPDYKDAAHARINILDGHAHLAFCRSSSLKRRRLAMSVPFFKSDG